MLKSAPLGAFELPRLPILTGEALREVRELEASIAAYGLFNPIIVTSHHGKGGRRGWRVVDGLKRLTAIKRMRFAGTLPRSLSLVPYIVADSPAEPHPLSLLSPIEQFEQVRDLHGEGLDVADIAGVLYAPEDYVEDVLSVARLSPRLRNAWFGGHIDLSQARAFATLPCPDSQDALLLALGPFAGAPAIMDAIAGGATVVQVGPGEDDMLILPSRTGGCSGAQTRLAA